jgi:hypothetical protein
LLKRLVVLLAFGLVLTACDLGGLFLDPEEGTIVDTPTAVVTGRIPDNAVVGGTVKVNGVTGTWTDDRNWTVEIPMAEDGYVTPVEAIYTQPNGSRYVQKSAYINGEKIDDGEFSPEGVGMRFTNEGIAGLGPVINSLAGSSFDISALILSQNPLIPPTDAGAGVTITGRAYEAGISDVNLAAGSTTSGVKTTITVKDLYIGLDLTLSGLISGPCKLELEVPTTTIEATFDFKPDAVNPDKVDVNLIGTPVVTTTGITYEFISGVCDPSTPLLGSIINSLAGSQIQDTVKNAFATQLGDPDGNGPLDSTIADAVETALSEINIAGPVGDAVGAHLAAPLTRIDEGATAIDFRSNADFSSSFGTGVGQCVQPPNAPDFTSSFDVAGAYPTLGATTPAGNPYGLGLIISSSAFNQLLSVMTECGLLNKELTEIDLNGAVLPTTSTILAGLVPEFGTKLPPNTPMLIRLDPQAAPFLTDAAEGPGGETAELMLADLHVDFIQPVAATPTSPAGEVNWLSLAVDAPLGFDMAFDSVNRVLAPTITAPPSSAVTTRVQTNVVKTDEENVETVFSNLFPMFVSGLSSSFAAFPLPSFLGLEVDVVEFARQGNSYILYSNLTPDPQTRIENVAVTDLSTPDFVNDSALFDSWEWRHRPRQRIAPNTVRVDNKSVIGVDACCTVDDETRSAHAGGRITFNVIPEHGDTWKLDLSHQIKGAHTLVSEGIGGGYAAQSRISTVTGQVRIGSGPWQPFSFNPSVMDSGRQTGHSNQPFTGSAATSIQGTTAETITVEFGFDVWAFSDSNLAFPAEAGNEAAVRVGANDSLTNNFTAGDYPGVGNRNIADDGYSTTIALTAIPAPPG